MEAKPAIVLLTVVLVASSIAQIGNQDQSAAEQTTEIMSETILATFAVVSDGHFGDTTYTDNLNGERNQIVVDSIVANGAERFFDCGDLIDESYLDSYYPSIKTIYDASGLPYHVMSGNHDNHEVLRSTFGYSESHYNVTDGEIVWIVLHSVDTTPGEINATQLAYLEDALTYYSTKLVFVLMHISNIKLAYPALEADGQNFQSILVSESDHIGGVFMGHCHNYNAMTYEINSVRYSYAGTYGNGYAMGGESHLPYRYLLVNVYDDWTVEIQAKCPDDESTVYGQSTSYIPDSGLSPVWNATSEPALASNVANWDNGLPTAGKTAIVNGTSVKNLTWDIDVGNSLYVMTGFTQNINQTVNTTFQDFSIVSGWYNPNSANRTEITGNALMTGTRIPNAVLRMELSGSYKKWAFPHNVPSHKEIIVSGSIQVKNNQYIATTGIGLNVTGSLEIPSGIKVTSYPFQSDVISGTITGAGIFQWDAANYGSIAYFPSITGSINSIFRLQSENSRQFWLTESLSLGGTLQLDKTLAGGATILDTQNYSLSFAGIAVDSNGVLRSRASNITCAGDWDTYNGSFEANTSRVIMTNSGSYAKLEESETFNEFEIQADGIRLIANTTNTIANDLNAMTMTVQRTQGYVTTILSYPSEPTTSAMDSLVVSWSIGNEEPDEAAYFTFSGLKPDTKYMLRIDSGIGSQVRTDGSGNLIVEYSGPWSNHSFALYVYYDGGYVGGQLIADFSYQIFEEEARFFDQSEGEEILTWFWDFGDGRTSADQNPRHIYKESGTYYVKMTVLDSKGVSDSITKVITVTVSSAPFNVSTTILVIAFGVISAGFLIVVISRRPTGAVVGIAAIAFGGWILLCA